MLNSERSSTARSAARMEHTDNPSVRPVAHSTLTAIMGRMSAYTGRAVTWEQALNSRQNLMPERLAWDMQLPVPAVAVPGQTELT